MTVPANKIQYSAYSKWWSHSPPVIERGLREGKDLARQIFGKNCKIFHLASSDYEMSLTYGKKKNSMSFSIADPFLFLTPEEIPAEFLVEEKDPLKAEDQNRKFFHWIGKAIPFEEFAQMATLYRYLWQRKDLMPRVRDMLIAERVVDLKRAPNHITQGFSLFSQMQNDTLPSLKGFIFSCAIPLCALGISTVLASICGVVWLSYWGWKLASIRRSSSETLLKDRMLVDATKDVEAAEVLLNGIQHVKANNTSSLTRFFHEKILGDANPLKRADLLKQYAKENKIQYVEPSWAKKPRMSTRMSTRISKGLSLSSIQLGIFAIYGIYVLIAIFLHKQENPSAKPYFPIWEPEDESILTPIEKCVYYAKNPARVFQCFDENWEFTGCDVVRKVFRRMALQLHPDHLEGREEAFAKLSAAKDYFSCR